MVADPDPVHAVPDGAGGAPATERSVGAGAAPGTGSRVVAAATQGTVSAASPDQIAAPDPDHKRRLRIIIYPFNQHLCKYVYINIPSF